MSTPLEPAVAFLPRAPQIDGRLDPGLQDLPARTFPALFKTAEDSPTVEATYRLAYGTDFFYLYLEWPAERIVCRDRGYQNGDGFILLLAMPRPEDEPTEEFYVLGFSAQDSPRTNWAQKITWYYNVDATLRMLSPDVQVAWQVQGGKAAFELLLPWSEVYPYHPWFYETIGFNLAFVEAVGEKEANYYAVLEDMDLGAEGAPRRYVRLRFAEPCLDQGVQVAMRMDRHCRAGETVRGHFALLAAGPAEVVIRQTVGPAEGGHLITGRFSLFGTAGLTRHDHDFPTSSLIPGGYRVHWRYYDYGAEGDVGLTVLPPLALGRLQARLQEAKGQIVAGSYATLQFQLEETWKQLSQVRPYETCGHLSIALAQWLEAVDAAASGQDPLVDRRGIFRRAFCSEIDGTLQPYSVCVPPHYDPAKRYPLLVMLHGSGMDDRGFLEVVQPVIPEDCLAIAPSARGTSHYYCPPEAQLDIQEAVADVVCSYSVDEERIVLGGFSMGGYGVYRTHYETPGRYKALAVFAGLVRLQPEHGFPDAPDFLQDEAGQALVGVPLFVFHGRQDHNVPIDDAVSLVERLRAAGSPVEFHIDEDKGHDAPGAETMLRFRRWLDQVVASD